MTASFWLEDVLVQPPSVGVRRPQGHRMHQPTGALLGLLVGHSIHPRAPQMSGSLGVISCNVSAQTSSGPSATGSAMVSDVVGHLVRLHVVGIEVCRAKPAAGGLHACPAVTDGKLDGKGRMRVALSYPV